MCVGCQTVKPKRELIRIVRTPENTVEVDLTGKKNGRGAYLCKDPECLDKAIKGKRLEKSLNTSISEEVIMRLKEELETDE
ncbi:MAG: uncharacterized protein PWP21_1376 [Thermosediminibacterales bacterium]|nr:uncharacterized protein [Thermosediminibacterales bacterium]